MKSLEEDSQPFSLLPDLPTDTHYSRRIFSGSVFSLKMNYHGCESGVLPWPCDLFQLDIDFPASPALHLWFPLGLPSALSLDLRPQSLLVSVCPLKSIWLSWEGHVSLSQLWTLQCKHCCSSLCPPLLSFAYGQRQQWRHLLVELANSVCPYGVWFCIWQRDFSFPLDLQWSPNGKPNFSSQSLWTYGWNWTGIFM